MKKYLGKTLITIFVKRNKGKEKNYLENIAQQEKFPLFRPIIKLLT